MRRKSARRGQAALEYLVTYGWGILAILVVVGALAYFGMFDIGRYLPDRCDLGSQIQCVDYQLAAADPSDADAIGYVRLQLRNGLGDSVNITGMWTAAGEPMELVSGTDRSSWPAQGLLVRQGNVSDIIEGTIPRGGVSEQIIGDERQSVGIIVEFRRDAAGSPRHNVTGEIFGSALEPTDYTGPPIIPSDEE